MKKILYLTIIFIAALSIASCDKWLDVNVNPNSPTNLSGSVSARLPWIQHFYGYAYGSASVNTAVGIGHLASNKTYSAYCDYSMGDADGPVAPYQQWYVGAASNLEDLISKAAEEGAWHYIGAAKVVKAMGYVMLADIYGEVIFTEACGSSLTPKYDDGKTVYEGCLKLLDEALEEFAKEQPLTATKLSEGDNWNGGDIQKWIKLCHGLKARWLNNMSKKSSLYNMETILAEIALGPRNESEGTVIQHQNVLSDNVGPDLNGDPVRTAFGFDMGAWQNYARINQWYINLLTNRYTGGSGEEDPRIDKLVPSCERWADLDGDGVKEKYWDRTKGVDIINGTVRYESTTAPLEPQFDAATKKWFVNDQDSRRLGDTSYLEIRSICAMQSGNANTVTRKEPDGTVRNTGTFYTWPDSPTDVLTYHEMCFIKAEILLRKQDEEGAFIAYKEGIRAHLQHMNLYLAKYTDSRENRSRQPMDQASIDDFLTNSKVVNDRPVTMSRIMQQKYIAMSLTLQNWNDMRRFNYSAGNIGGFGVIYVDFDRPYTFRNSPTSASSLPGTNKTDENYWFRRYRHSALESRYNKANLLDSNPDAMNTHIWSVPVWWDKAE